MSGPTQQYLSTVRELSDRMVEAQRPIRILDTIKWHADIRESFFASGCRELPTVDADYYASRNPLESDYSGLL